MLTFLLYRLAPGLQRGIVALLLCGLVLLMPGGVVPVQVLLANPEGGAVATGSAGITSRPGQVTVTQQSDRAVINWKSFDIRQGETTTFVQPGVKSAVLNRVTGGGGASQIDGSLKANGQVYLVNKNGVMVGKTGRVNTGGFTASTRDLDNAQFMKGGDLTFSGNSSAAVVNYGKIKAADGDVTLIARQVENHGRITARKGQVHLAAGGSEVLVKPSGTEGQRVFIRGSGANGGAGPGEGGAVVNTGSIRATAAELRAAGGNEYALAINNTGVIRATGADHSGGRIVLKAQGGTVVNSGRLVARGRAPGKSGGSIAVGGDRVRLASGSVVDAGSDFGKGGEVKIGGGFQGKDATVANARTTEIEGGARINVDGGSEAPGLGGTAIVWSDERTDFGGHISALGAGFVEVSSKGLLNFRGVVETGGGTLLLDPFSLTITDGLTSNPGSPTSATNDSTLSAADLVSLLASGNVTLQATHFIAVRSAVSSASGSNLTLDTAALHLYAPISLGGGTLAGTASLLNVYVSGGGRIQNAVDAVVAGGNVWLQAGTYAENNIQITKGLSLYGAGADHTIVDGSATPASVFVVNAPGGQVNMQGLGITGGQSPIGGGGIQLLAGALSLSHARLSANSATGDSDGGGIRHTSTGLLSVSDVVFLNNTAANGGGIQGSGPTYITNSTFTTNGATVSDGGAISMGTSALTIIDSTFTGNTGYRGGAIFHNGSTLSISGSLFTSNQATGSAGGALFIDAPSVAVVADSVFESNVAQMSGGAIYSYSTLSISNSTFRTNSAQQQGGAISSLFRDLTVSGTLFEGNSTTATGSGFGGGAIHAMRAVTLTDSTLTLNTSARDGGAILLTDRFLNLTRTTLDGNTASRHGGGIYATADTITVTDSTFQGNTAGSNGGGIYFMPSEAEATLTISGTTLRNNHAGGSGGGVMHFNGVMKMSNSTVEGNNSDVSGGGIYISAGSGEVTESLVYSNTAGTHGGGVYISGPALLLVRNSTLALNVATQQGGGIRASGTDLTIQSSTIYGNSGADGGGIFYDGVTNSVTINNTILAGNNNVGQDYSIGTTLNSSTHNLIGTGNRGTDFTGFGNNSIDVTGVSLRLSPLGYYGGPTRTYALLTGSPALNAGNPALATGGSIDQRGRGRDAASFAGAVDIGAFEVHTSGGSYVVTSAADYLPASAVAGSLRYGLNNSHAERINNITFNIPTSDGYNPATGVWTINFTNGQANLFDGITIDGSTQPGYVANSGKPVIVIDMGNANRFASITATVATEQFIFNALHLTRGLSTTGGAISITSGELIIRNSVLTSNAATVGGGAVYLSSTSKGVVEYSTFSANSSPLGAAIQRANSGTLDITGSSFINNLNGYAFQLGGGTTTITNSTFYGNVGHINGLVGSVININSSTLGMTTGGNGLRIFGADVRVARSIFADSAASLDIDLIDGIYQDLGYNVIESTNTSTVGTGTVIGQPALLSALGWYGGPTQTLGLLPGSAALNRVDAGVYPANTTDQRGVQRLAAAVTDSGAFESRSFYTVTNTQDYNPATVTHIDGSLRLGLAINAAGLAEGATVNFNIPSMDAGYNPITGQWTITSAGGSFTITNGVLLDGVAQPAGPTAANGPRIVIDGNNLDSVFYVNPGFGTGKSVTMDSLDITNGAGRLSGSNRAGGGIYLQSGSMRVFNSRIYDNNVNFQGGGVYIRDNTDTAGVRTLTLTDTIVANNSAGQDGGGIFSSGRLILTDTSVTGNSITTGDGGGIFMNTDGQLTATRATISYNRASNTQQGGGIAMTSIGTMTDSLVVGNQAQDGGGIQIYGTNGHLTLTDTRVISNVARLQGGGIRVNGSRTLIVNGGTIASNKASTGGGVQSAGSLTLGPSGAGVTTVASNYGLNTGGGVYVTAGSATISGDTRFILNLSATGGGLAVSSGAWSNISNTTFAGNVSIFGGGIWNSGTLTLDQSTLVGNFVDQWGAGIYHTGTASTITYTTFRGNRALVNGGGLMLNAAATGTQTVDSSTFSYNMANSGGGLFTDATLLLSRSTFAYNQATSGGHGGGITVGFGTTTLNTSTISANTGPTGGGLSLTGGALTLSNTIIAGNAGPNDVSRTGGAFSDNGYNLLGIHNLPGVAGTTAVGVLNPGLAPLGSYGGLTETMGLLPGSPALGQANPALNGTSQDQRGVLRNDGAPDIGAFESRGFTYTIVGGDNQTAVLGTTFAQPLVVRVAALDPGLISLAGGTITLSVPGAGATAAGALTMPLIFSNGNNDATFLLTASTALGTYKVGVTNALPGDLAFTLTNAAIPVVVRASSGQGKTYGQADPGSFGYSLVDSSGAPLSITLNGNLLRFGGEDVGAYGFDISQLAALNGNYVISLAGTSVFTISPALLTVTATDSSGTSGQPFPTLGGTISGFQFADSAEVIFGLTYVTNATAASPAGMYAIIPGGAFARNYRFLYIPGTLTIAEAPPVVALPTLDTTAFNATRGRNNENEAYYLVDNLYGTYTISYEGTPPTTSGGALLHLNSAEVVPPAINGRNGRNP